MKSVLKRVLIIVLSIGSIILLFLFLRWVGLKGLLSLMIGMFIMAWLLLSKNQLLLWVIKKTEGGDYLEEVKGKESEEKEQVGKGKGETGEENSEVEREIRGSSVEEKDCSETKRELVCRKEVEVNNS